jgi:Ni/Co efflux regulator RcnB
MKKLLLMLVAVAVFLGTAAFAQDTSSSSGGQSSTMGSDTGKSDKAAKAPLKTIKGTVKAEGDKVQFVADKDNKTWDVMNPEALKGHEGHHVAVKAHVYADKDQIHVMDVKMLKAKGEKGEKASKSDSMSH